MPIIQLAFPLSDSDPTANWLRLGGADPRLAPVSATSVGTEYYFEPASSDTSVLTLESIGARQLLRASDRDENVRSSPYDVVVGRGGEGILDGDGGHDSLAEWRVMTLCGAEWVVSPYSVG